MERQRLDFHQQYVSSVPMNILNHILPWRRARIRAVRDVLDPPVPDILDDRETWEIWDQDGTRYAAPRSRVAQIKAVLAMEKSANYKVVNASQGTVWSDSAKV